MLRPFLLLATVPLATAAACGFKTECAPSYALKDIVASSDEWSASGANAVIAERHKSALAVCQVDPATPTPPTRLRCALQLTHARVVRTAEPHRPRAQHGRVVPDRTRRWRPRHD